MSRVTPATQPERPVSRRTVLGAMAGGLLLAPFAGLRAQAMQSDLATRSLSFVHTHTGEQLSVDYWCEGVFQTQCLAPLNHFLRDFRTGEVANMDAGLLDILYELQVQADREATFEIISAYRSPATNAALGAKSSGVAKKSLHMEGRAIDIRMTGFSTRKLQQLALANQRGGVGYYAKSDFVHVDTGRVRSWVG
jgi:uncharacterized protein YcbK (DUF882 family)